MTGEINMYNVIRINMENFASNLIEIMREYFQPRGHKLIEEDIEIIDGVLFNEDYNMYDSYVVRYSLEGVHGQIHAQTGEELPEILEIRTLHKQYDFTTHTLYGFYELVSVSCIEGVNTRDMWHELSEISLKIMKNK